MLCWLELHIDKGALGRCSTCCRHLIIILIDNLYFPCCITYKVGAGLTICIVCALRESEWLELSIRREFAIPNSELFIWRLLDLFECLNCWSDIHRKKLRNMYPITSPFYSFLCMNIRLQNSSVWFNYFYRGNVIIITSNQHFISYNKFFCFIQEEFQSFFCISFSSFTWADSVSNMSSIYCVITEIQIMSEPEESDNFIVLRI